MIKISPSILSADFARLGEETRRLCAAGADYIHVDVMDGRFVPNLTLGPPVIAALKPYAAVPLDVHLMISAPGRLLDAFLRAGADILTVHAEAAEDSEALGALLGRIRAAGASPAAALRPATPLSAVLPLLPLLDMVLVMTVEPGFGGQPFMEDMLPKIRALRGEFRARGLSARIEVDGGINPGNAARVAAAGADVFVAGSALFRAPDLSAAVKDLRRAAQEGAGPFCAE